MNWEDGSHVPHQLPCKTPVHIESRILDVRAALAKQSDLGEFGAQAIRDHMLGLSDFQELTPSVPTINRILRRNGIFDGRRRTRRPSPLPGWYLPEVVSRRAEIDETDFVEGLYLEGGLELCTLNLISLHGGWCASWLNQDMKAPFVRASLVSHWREFGIPNYAQFDNGNVFTGPKQYSDAIGTVIRMCLSLAITPVFAVPREFGIQSAIESYNNQWQQKVWQRFHFESQAEVQSRSDRYVSAVRQKRRQRQDDAPTRRDFPEDWVEPVHLHRQGQIIFLRRTTGQGCVDLLGRECVVGKHWCNRLVRCEVDLTTDNIRIYGLRRQAPEEHKLLIEWPYRLPDKSRKLSQQME